MYIAWTTVSTAEQAERLAAGIIEQRLAACVQVEGPLISHYRWEGKLARETEYRLSMKCLEIQLTTLETYVLRHHPYEIPEWIAVRAEHVAEKYLSWAAAVSTS